jgi:hypothetical protein
LCLGKEHFILVELTNQHLIQGVAIKIPEGLQGHENIAKWDKLWYQLKMVVPWFSLNLLG